MTLSSRQGYPLLLLLPFVSSCAASLSYPNGSSTNNTSLTQQSKVEASLTNTRFTFNQSDFYTLAKPNPSTGCAGDANAFYDAIELNGTTPLKFALDLSDNSTTIRPSFIKNVSVDITDANSTSPSNQASSCSFGTISTAPPPTDCATFDYGAVGGIPSLLGGTLILTGGVPEPPGNPIPPPSMFALGVQNSATSSTPGTTANWSNLSSVSGYSGPPNKVGAQAAYDTALQKILLFGGAAPSSGIGPAASVVMTGDTWIYSLATEQWIQTTVNSTVSPGISQSADLNPFNNNTASFPNQSAGMRALFGYTNVQGMGISYLGATGQIYTGQTGDTLTDTTDRIAIVGGYCSPLTPTTCQDTHLLNPTYAPEHIDLASTISPISPNLLFNPTPPVPLQYLNNYYMRIISNSSLNSNYSPTAASPLGFASPSPAPIPSGLPDTSVSFGLVSISNNVPINTGNSVTPTTGVGAVTFAANTIIGNQIQVASNTTFPGAGYLVAAGGFHGFNSQPGTMNIPSGNCPSLLHCGNLDIMTKWFSNLSNNYTSQTISPPPAPGPSPSVEPVERSTANFTSVANFNFPQSNEYPAIQGLEMTPGEWVPIAEPSNSPTGTPWFGAGVLLKGLNHQSNPASPNQTNEVVFVGGSPCQNYLTNSTTCTQSPAPSPSVNPGVYWTFGVDPMTSLFGQNGIGAPTGPAVISMGGTPPINAGMAAARGADSQGNPIIVAWGGMTSPGIVDATNQIYYLYWNNTTNKPTWASFTPASYPPPLSNAALVFSHVTGQFYLFGGYNPVQGITSSSTWSLSIGKTGTSANCGVQGSANCTFTWSDLDGNQSCYPNCPPARRSHRMVEANYHYFNAPNEPNCSSPGAPCSFGIFMEGGTPDGISLLGDRWMFDPTANAGNGLWQLMGDLPPRKLGAMTHIDYTLPSTGQTLARALLFGGETGMLSPPASASTGYFVPPTLGDTWMYDYSNQSWNRVLLNGMRYPSWAKLNQLSEADARAASSISTAGFLLSPPPLSGAMMVTRTQFRPHHSSQDITTPLAIPEVFLFGGRTKDGHYSSMNSVYKFCAGSTGEKPSPTSITTGISTGTDNATCDAFDPIENPQSLSPTSGYTGRWLVKTPPAPTNLSGVYPDSIASYQGAAAYDSLHDLIVFYGGLTPNTPTAAFTAITGTALLDHSGTVYEYTPPSAVNDSNPAHLNGSWAAIGACSESPHPVGRFGHTLSYDSLNETLDLVGGSDINGNPITQTVSISGTTQTIPDVWTATRIDWNSPNGLPQKGIPPITDAPCYYWQPVQNYGNNASASLTTGLINAASVFVPPSGYDSGYYTTDDTACIGSGPIASTDSLVSRIEAGGAYIDIDRTQLGATENLIMNLTFMPLGRSNTGPDQNYLNSDQSALFKIHLIQTKQSGDTIRTEAQPRYLTYSSTVQFPEIIPNLSLITPPTGQIRQEQVYIPLSANPNIDRIRIERYSGNAILIDASVFRLGKPQ